MFGIEVVVDLFGCTADMSEVSGAIFIPGGSDDGFSIDGVEDDIASTCCGRISPAHIDVPAFGDGGWFSPKLAHN